MLIVREIRMRMLLTQAQFSKHLGVSRQMVWAYEKGRSLPSFEVAKKLIEIAKQYKLEVNAYDFFVNKEIKNE